MAYNSEDMRLMGGVPGQQLFIYRSTDADTTVSTSGYFNEAVEEYNLDTGDIVIACTGDDNASGIDVMVAKNSSGTVSMIK